MATQQKRIVCDIDDTISITLNRDWQHAKPIQPVIDKINKLYDQGWEIYLVTARGNLSCATREEADKKYRPQIEKWLKEHGVKYTLLSFQKYLAAYYVDDKGLTPEEFVNLEIKNLQDGWSGATVELREGKVFKTHPDSLRAGEWYKIARSFFNVPEIYTLIGQTLCMEYIEKTSDVIKMPDIIELLRSMRDIPYTADHSNDYGYYIERIKNHIELAKTTAPQFGRWLEYHEKNLGLQHALNTPNELTFCHGDLTLENIIMHNGKMYLIDPIYENDRNTYSTWMLDASKFAYSLRLHGMMTEYIWLYRELYRKFKDIVYLKDNVNLITAIKLLEASHCIRVYKYAPIEKKIQVTGMFTDIMNEIDR